MVYGLTCSEVLPNSVGYVAGPTLSAASTPASCIPPQCKFTIPANIWSQGKVLNIKMYGKISSVITTPGTARFDVRLGSTVVFDGLAVLLDTVAAHTNVSWRLEIDLTCYAIGTSANLMGHGVFYCENILGEAASMPKANGIAMLPWNSTPAVGSNFDSTAPQTLDSFFTQTVGTGSLTVQQFIPKFEN